MSSASDATSQAPPGGQPVIATAARDLARIEPTDVWIAMHPSELGKLRTVPHCRYRHWTAVIFGSMLAVSNEEQREKKLAYKGEALKASKVHKF